MFADGFENGTQQGLVLRNANQRSIFCHLQVVLNTPSRHMYTDHVPFVLWHVVDASKKTIYARALHVRGWFLNGTQQVPNEEGNRAAPGLVW